jgi:hypothetical protein
MRNGFVVLLILTLTITSLIMVESANAQTPSTPIFNVKTTSGYYAVPTTYSTDPYTGATITNHGYTVNSINITFTIKNTSNTSFYLLQFKGHYISQWSTLYEDGYNVTTFASSEPQTILTIFGTNSSGPIGQTPANEITLYFSDDWAINLALGSQIDFRLQAVSGSLYVSPLYGANHQLAVGEASDWSNTQTVTLPETSASTSPNSTPTPAVPEFPSLVVLPLFLSMLFVAVILRHRKTASLSG